MKVALVHRPRRAGVHSIEELFEAMAGEFPEGVELARFQMGSRAQLPRDIVRLWRMKADVYHVTGDVHYVVPLLPRGRSVLTIHDIEHYRFGLRGAKRTAYRLLWLDLPLRAASTVTCISPTTRDSIRNHLGSNVQLQVVPNCHSPTFKPSPETHSNRCPVILQVGTAAHKNAPRLVEALRGIRCELVIIGELNRKLQECLTDCRVRYRNYVNISHEEVYHQYVQSDLVAFVSLREGFGVPIIEAQAVGRPLLTSNLPPMCEVSGAGACLVDPMSVSSIRQGVERILGDREYRELIVQRGFDNVRRYSPAAIASAYHDVYRSIAGA